VWLRVLRAGALLFVSASAASAECQDAQAERETPLRHNIEALKMIESFSSSSAQNTLAGQWVQRGRYTQLGT